jgi:hypothetical protein
MNPVHALTPYSFKFTFSINKVFSGYQACRLVKNHQRFRDQLCPHHQGIALGTEIVPETLVGVALGHYPDDWDTDGP